MYILNMVASSSKNKKRSFNVFYNGVDIKTHPTGTQPKQAARKAITPIIKYMMDRDNVPKDKQKDNVDYINKEFIFYIVENKKDNDEQTRHYYRGIRKSVNPDINFYLTKIDPDTGKKTTIDIDEYNGKIIQDSDGNVIEVKIPHKFKIYKTVETTTPDGKKETTKEVVGEDIKYIPYKHTNEVFKLTYEYYIENKDIFKLPEDQETDLLTYIKKKTKATKKNKSKEKQENPEKNDDKEIKETNTPEVTKTEEKITPKKPTKDNTSATKRNKKTETTENTNKTNRKTRTKKAI